MLCMNININFADALIGIATKTFANLMGLPTFQQLDAFYYMSILSYHNVKVCSCRQQVETETDCCSAARQLFVYTSSIGNFCVVWNLFTQCNIVSLSLASTHLTLGVNVGVKMCG